MFGNSNFGKTLENSKLNLLVGTSLPVLATDEAHSLQRDFLRVCPEIQMFVDEKKKHFNYPLSRAIKFSENSLGISAQNFRSLDLRLRSTPEVARIIVSTT
jgi:hypothetical protein